MIGFFDFSIIYDTLMMDFCQYSITLIRISKAAGSHPLLLSSVSLPFRGQAPFPILLDPDNFFGAPGRVACALSNLHVGSDLDVVFLLGFELGDLL